MKVNFEYSGNNEVNDEGDVQPVFEDKSVIYPIDHVDMPHEASHVAGYGTHNPMPRHIKELSERLPRSGGDRHAAGATAVYFSNRDK